MNYSYDKVEEEEEEGRDMGAALSKDVLMCIAAQNYFAQTSDLDS